MNQNEYDLMVSNLTNVQARCTELLDEKRALARKLKEIEEDASLPALLSQAIKHRLAHARQHHPEGANLAALVSEVGELADDMLANTCHRNEALDVAIVALRIYLGETG